MAIKLIIYEILTVGIGLISKPLFGQSVPETAFYWENPYSINPASVNFDYTAFFTISGRKQWTGIKGAPSTYFATATYYSEDYRTQGGIKIGKDKIGYMGSLDLAVSYTYTLPLYRNGWLNLGIAGSYQSQSIDREKIIMGNDKDPVLEDERLKGLKKWNTALGIEYTYARQIKIGIACQNLFSFFQEEDNIFEGTGFFYARYRTRYLGRSHEAGRYRTLSIPRSCDIEAGVCIKQYRSNLQADGMLSLYINRETQEEKFQFSLFGRTTGEIGILAGLKLISDIKFLCTYDYNFQALQKYSHGTFEVMVSFPVHRKRTGRCLYL